MLVVGLFLLISMNKWRRRFFLAIFLESCYNAMGGEGAGGGECSQTVYCIYCADVHVAFIAQLCSVDFIIIGAFYISCGTGVEMVHLFQSP